MDGLSVAASIIAVLQLTGEVIKYLNDVKDAPKECQQCMTEASNLQSLLINLLYHLDQRKTGNAWYTTVQALNVENGPLDQYKQALEQLRSKVEVQDGIQKIKRRLLWRFSKDEAASILARMERLKSLASAALGMDHFKLSLAIKEDSSSVRDTLPCLQTDVAAVRDKQNLQWDAQKLQQHNTIMEWLSPTDFPAQQHDIITRRQEGTGQWFLDTPEFKRWVQGPEKTLFCPGIPGAGKTMMAAIAIDHLYKPAGNDGIGVAYLFCSYKAQADQTAPSLLAALLKQLVQSRPDIAAPVQQMYEEHSKQKKGPSMDEIIRVQQSVCSKYTTVYIVVDALDECASKARNQLIDKLRELQARTDVRLLFTSRHIPEIRQKFQCDPILEVRASDEDVGRYIQGRINDLPRCIQRDDELKCVVQNKIVEIVDGMFLLARLHVDSLLDKRNKQKVLSTLKKLSKGSAALDDAYSDALERIDGQLAGDRLLARHALSWISYVERLLTTTELCHALAIEPGDKALNVDNVYDVEDIISACAGLVIVDEESSIIRLVHYTTQEYFERIRTEWNPSAQEEIAVACLTYLSFDIFRSGSCGRDDASEVSDEDFEDIQKVRKANDKAFEQRLNENPFFDYTAQYWSEHVRPVQDVTLQLALAFLDDKELVDSAAQGALLIPGYEYAGYSRTFANRTTGLHLTAMYGLHYLTQKILTCKHGDSNMRADSKDGYGQTPLLHAARQGHGTVVKLLVERDDVDANSRDNSGRTPLLWAAEEGHEEVAKLLVERDDVDANSKDDNGRTPLSWAARRGYEVVVKLLVERGTVEADSRDANGKTPLSWAAKRGHEAVVKLLAERGDVEADSRDENSKTPLSWAAGEGHEAVVRLLVERDDVEADSKDTYGRTPLSWAAGEGHEAVVRLLVERDNVKADSKDTYGRTPLSWAAGEGHEAVVRLLLERDDVKADSKDNYCRTPLSWVAGEGHEVVVRLLLERDGVNAESRDNHGWTPLFWAVKGGHEEVVKLLIERDDVDADSRDVNGKTPLSWAAGEGQEAVVRLLVERDDVEVNSKDKYGQTPLSWAAMQGHEAIVKLLVEQNNVEADSKDEYGRTPLRYAAEIGHEAVVKLLVERDDVKVDSKDKNGQTPLSWAAAQGHEAIIKLLIERDDVEADSKDTYGRTPLLWAVWGGHEAIVRLLLKRDDVEANSKDEYGWTPLSLAAENGREAIVRLLLKRDDVEANSKDEYGRTSLSLAAVRRHQTVVRLLQPL